MFVVIRGHRKRVGNAALALEIDAGRRVGEYRLFSPLSKRSLLKKACLVFASLGPKEWFPNALRKSA
jgi:hypothetical protein